MLEGFHKRKLKREREREISKRETEDLEPRVPRLRWNGSIHKRKTQLLLPTVIFENSTSSLIKLEHREGCLWDLIAILMCFNCIEMLLNVVFRFVFAILGNHRPWKEEARLSLKDSWPI
jgi:hypothetical protein